MEDDEADLYEDLPAQGPATTAPVVAGRHLAQLRQAAARAAAADAGQGDGGDSSDEDVGQEEGESLGILVQGMQQQHVQQDRPMLGLLDSGRCTALASWPASAELYAAVDPNNAVSPRAAVCHESTRVTFLPATTYQYTQAVHTLMLCGSVVWNHHWDFCAAQWAVCSTMAGSLPPLACQPRPTDLVRLLNTAAVPCRGGDD